ncbi:hypothetical protein ACIRL2_46645 [Embleya sp. NPDC127516]|uniref:hypothetical protein n=1 Tax=Embleya sp. NPDC127516 TaxID=3363990 RepID=UPI0037F66B8F
MARYALRTRIKGGRPVSGTIADIREALPEEVCGDVERKVEFATVSEPAGSS